MHWHINCGSEVPFAGARKDSLGEALETYFSLAHAFTDKVSPAEEETARQQVTEALTKQSDLMSTIEINGRIRITIIPCDEGDCDTSLDN